MKFNLLLIGKHNQISFSANQQAAKKLARVFGASAKYKILQVQLLTIL